MAPIAPTEIDAQYRALREEAGVLAVPGLAWIEAKGSDAAEYLEGQLTNEVASLNAGDGAYAALLDRKGRMQADMRVLRRADDEFLIELPATTADPVLAHLDRYKVASDVGFEPLADRALIRVAGPGAVACAGVPPLGEHGSRAHLLGRVEGFVIGTAWGVDFLCAASDAEAAVAVLCEAGAEPVDFEALEIIRVEAGIPRYGCEIDETTIPQEAGLNARAVSFTKGCYVGQETVARLHYKGKPNRYLRRLVLDAPVEAGAAVANDERELGKVGTAVISPARGPLALAILRREAAPGDRVMVGGAGVGATVEDPQ